LHTIYSDELDHRAECYGIILFTDDAINRVDQRGPKIRFV